MKKISEIEINGEVYGLAGASEKKPAKLTIPRIYQRGVNDYGSIKSTESTNRCTAGAICFVPYIGVHIRVFLPEGYRAYFWMGDWNFSSYSPWLNDGDELTINNCFYRIVFGYGNDDTIDASTVTSLIEDGSIRFEYDRQDDVIERNADRMVQVGALKRILLDTLADNGMNSMAVFGHISDCHGDVARLENCFEFCDYIGADALLGTGDMIMYQSSNLNSFQEVIAAAHQTPYLFCTGNHEVQGGEYLESKFADNMSVLVQQQGYLASSGVVTNECYYYKDFDSKKIRVIALDYYNGNGTSLGQSQINWFIATLASTPAGYGVIILIHSPEDRVIIDVEHSKFRQKHRVIDYQEDGYYVGNRPIRNIVDAFIEKVAFTDQFSDGGITVTINADFTNVESGVEFICYACGHRHEDWIGVYNGSTNRQLCLDITAGTCWYGGAENPAYANQEDLPRGTEGVCQDAFNIYAIDRVNKSVKIVRIGANITEDFSLRDYMIIPYAD